MPINFSGGNFTAATSNADISLGNLPKKLNQYYSRPTVIHRAAMDYNCLLDVIIFPTHARSQLLTGAGTHATSAAGRNRLDVAVVRILRARDSYRSLPWKMNRPTPAGLHSAILRRSFIESRRGGREGV